MKKHEIYEYWTNLPDTTWLLSILGLFEQSTAKSRSPGSLLRKQPYGYIIKVYF